VPWREDAEPGAADGRGVRGIPGVGKLGEERCEGIGGKVCSYVHVRERRHGHEEDRN
jgi:hypothetical protein